MSLTQIDSDCKLAREYALLGNYDTAMVYYQGVLQEVLLSTTAGVGSRGRAPEGCEGTGSMVYYQGVLQEVLLLHRGKAPGPGGEG